MFFSHKNVIRGIKCFTRLTINKFQYEEWILFKNMKIGVRLAIGFGVMLCLLCSVGLLGIYQTSRVDQGTEELANNWLPSVEALGAVQNSANAVRRATMNFIMEDAPSARQADRKDRADALDALNRNMKSYEGLVSSVDERRLYERIDQQLTTYIAADNKAIALADQDLPDALTKARKAAAGPADDLFKAAASTIRADVVLNKKGSEAEALAANASYQTAVMWTSILIAVAIAVGIAIAWFVTQSITAPMRWSVEIAETVASGDLTSVINVTHNDETGQLLKALRHMNERLAAMVTGVRNSSLSISSGAIQIAAGNTDLSQRTEEQAASLEETAASMEELTATVKLNVENAEQGNALAKSASATAMRGGEVVRQVVDTMRQISNSSDQVAHIISVIEGIAFQTNILALNAAVEAARAGEQGRGFAVVAGEVRSLAQRSATAAKEIKDLIGESVTCVSSGVSLVEDAGRTMDEIVRSVRQVTDLMGEITAASTEQYTGIEQVNQAVMQMDEVTQQNAALVEEASAAAQSMAHQSLELEKMVGAFKVNHTEQWAGGGARPPSSAISANDKSSKLQRGPRNVKSNKLVPATRRPHEGDWASF
jgi:methyl-accepting chemotaxis protein